MVVIDENAQNDYPLATSKATKMLAAGIERAGQDGRTTQRDIAKRLNYKTSVALSHMALGRVAIPIDRAGDIAKILDLDQRQFLLAVLRQRHPEIVFEDLFGLQIPHESALASDLEALAGVPLDDLPDETKHVLRETVGSRDPGRRWLSLAEVPIVDLLRERFPTLRHEGLSHEHRQALAILLSQAQIAER